jgi:hypothetical protein
LEKARWRTHLAKGEAPAASPRRPWPAPLRRRSGRRAVRRRPGRSRLGRGTTLRAGVDEAIPSTAGTTVVLKRGRRRVAVGGRVAEAQVRAIHVAAQLSGQVWTKLSPLPQARRPPQARTPARSRRSPCRRGPDPRSLVEKTGHWWRRQPDRSVVGSWRRFVNEYTHAHAVNEYTRTRRCVRG